MTPTTRNTLMIGGALIVIALLLTCGPMRGLFGGGEDATETVAATDTEPETPPVSAAPPADDVDAMAMAGVATSGAATGAGAGANGAAVAGLDEGAAGQASADDAADETVVAAAAVAPVGAASGGSSTGAGVGTAATAAGVGAATAGAGAAAGASGSGSSAATAAQTATPPVSTGPPVPAVAVADTSAADAAAAAAAAAAGAASAFDDAYASLSGEGIDAAGKVVDRFAPPVAAVPTGGLAMNGAQRSVGSSIGGVRQPCDSPGAGCRNTLGGARPPTPPANLLIVPGQRPPRGGGADQI